MSADPDPPRWLSVSEAADRLGVSGPTVRRRVKAGHLNAAQPAPLGAIRIPEDELDHLADRRAVMSVADAVATFDPGAQAAGRR
jgi:excisionase family DNA binding protein